MGRCIASLVALGACYAPRPAQGVPCDPADDHCPSGQRCTPGFDGFTCQPAGAVSDADPGDDTTPDPDATTDTTLPTDAPSMVQRVEYMSVVAECVDRDAPDPDACVAVNGSGQLVLDLQDSMTGQVFDGFVRFDLDSVLAGKTVVAVRLRMRTTTAAKAPSDQTGTVWQVQPFTRSSLFAGEPGLINPALAGTQGAIGADTVVEWTLPGSAAAANGSVYLGLRPASDDGVNYWNQTNANRPRLVIDYQ